jgi:hypothetical protein
LKENKGLASLVPLFKPVFEIILETMGRLSYNFSQHHYTRVANQMRKALTSKRKRPQQEQQHKTQEAKTDATKSVSGARHPTRE